MIFNRLGRTGVKVSRICLGTMQFGWTVDETDAHKILSAAVDQGINFIDTADIYSRWVPGNPGGVSEEIIGRWVNSASVPRHQLVLATKVRGRMGEGPNDEGLSRQHIIHAAEMSLRRLRTDYIDLYQAHWPDDDTQLEETLMAFDHLVQSGKVRYIGCSNFPAWLLVKSLWISDRQGVCRFDTLQPHYNLAHRAEYERELQPVAADQGLGVIPYSPLAAGFLTGKYRRDDDLPASERASAVQQRYLNKRGFKILDTLLEVAVETDSTPAQTAVAWLLANRTVTSAIVGANTIEQLSDTVQGAGLQLTEEQKSRLDAASSWD